MPIWHLKLGRDVQYVEVEEIKTVECRMQNAEGNTS